MDSHYPAHKHAINVLNNLIPLLSKQHRCKPQLLLLRSKPVTYRDDTDRELPYRQESNFYYLSGCLVPDSTLVVSYTPPNATPNANANAEGEEEVDVGVHPDSVQTTLFIPPEDPIEVLWSPAPPSLAETVLSHQVTSVLPTPSLPAQLFTLLQSSPVLHLLPESSFPLLPGSISGLVKEYKGEGTRRDCLLPALHLARLIKDEHEIELIRRANAISSRAHELVMRLLGEHAHRARTRTRTREGEGEEGEGGKVEMPGEWRIESEQEAEAVFVAACRREGAKHQAYLPIVASSTRASTLHYCCNDKSFAWGPLPSPSHPHSHSHSALGGLGSLLHGDGNGNGKEEGLQAQVLLIDAGCEWDCYASDITRVTPIGNNGHFSPQARDIYLTVLHMQTTAISLLRPGLHWDVVQLSMHRILVQSFLKLGIFRGEEDEVLKSGVSAAFFPHGVGHSLGLDVHDVPSASKPERPEGDRPGEKGEGEKGGEGGENPEFYTWLRLRLPLRKGM
ncbi:Creatinase/aminopeptidase, partial [Dacryopinax primogenitus]